MDELGCLTVSPKAKKTKKRKVVDHHPFSKAITDFSVLYAPEEYGADASATMRVTAYGNGNFVGTTTTNAQPGTWPSETLGIHAASGFNSVVVHYDAPPLNPQEGLGPGFYGRQRGRDADAATHRADGRNEVSGR